MAQWRVYLIPKPMLYWHLCSVSADLSKAALDPAHQFWPQRKGCFPVVQGLVDETHHCGLSLCSHDFSFVSWTLSPFLSHFSFFPCPSNRSEAPTPVWGTGTGWLSRCPVDSMAKPLAALLCWWAATWWGRYSAARGDWVATALGWLWLQPSHGG